MEGGRALGQRPARSFSASKTACDPWRIASSEVSHVGAANSIASRHQTAGASFARPGSSSRPAWQTPKLYVATAGDATHQSRVGLPAVEQQPHRNGATQTPGCRVLRSFVSRSSLMRSRTGTGGNHSFMVLPPMRVRIDKNVISLST